MERHHPTRRDVLAAAGLATASLASAGPLARAQDVGVSYALAGVVGVLTYRIAAPWRYLYLAAVLAVYGIPFVTGRTFTDLGHFTSVLLGLACYPLTRGRGKAWNPKETAGTFRS